MTFYVEIHYKGQSPYTTHMTTTCTNQKTAKAGVLEWAEEKAQQAGRTGKPIKRSATRC